MKFDFTAKKTEPQWADAIYRLVAGLAHAVFTLVGWAMIIAAIAYLHDKSGDRILGVTEGVLHALLVVYILLFCTLRLEIRLFPKASKYPRVRFWAELVVNAGVALPLYFGLRAFMDALIEVLTRLKI